MSVPYKQDSSGKVFVTFCGHSSQPRKILLRILLRILIFGPKCMKCIMAYKIIKKLRPESLWGKFQHVSPRSNYATRHCRDLQIPRLNTEHVKESYQYSTLKIWSTIPTDIRELPKIRRISGVW